MFIKEVTVRNKIGLHARSATFFIQKANEFKSTIWIEKTDSENGKQRVNAKSLLGVLSLGVLGGVTVKILADGPDEEKAATTLVKLIEAGCV